MHALKFSRKLNSRIQLYVELLLLILSQIRISSKVSFLCGSKYIRTISAGLRTWSSWIRQSKKKSGSDKQETFVIILVKTYNRKLILNLRKNLKRPKVHLNEDNHIWVRTPWGETILWDNHSGGGWLRMVGDSVENWWFRRGPSLFGETKSRTDGRRDGLNKYNWERPVLYLN